MSKASDLNSYPTSDNIGKLHQEIMALIQSRSKHMNDAVYNLTEEEIIELADYIDYFHKNHYTESFSSDINLDKIKAFILLYSKLSDADDADNILSYLESVEFGWHGDRYYLNNTCLQHLLYSSRGHCKMASTISYPELSADMLGNVYDIFFNKAFSPITLFVFSYCLASLYSSMLNAGGVSVPLFLQIAVDKTSAAYQLLKEIAEICDVNSGILEKCAYSDSLYIRCNCSSQIYFPTQSVRNDIENLIRDSKDRPVLIVGHENEHGYGALLREIANIPTKKKALDLRSRFNLLPIFICPEIKSSFDNVFSIDLTDVEVSSEYLELVKRNKYRLASWALKLIADDNIFLHEREAVDRRKIAGRRSIISSKIRPYINLICQDHTELTMDSARNVGFMKYFS